MNLCDLPGGLIRSAADIDDAFMDALLSAHDDGYREPMEPEYDDPVDDLWWIDPDDLMEV